MGSVAWSGLHVLAVFACDRGSVSSEECFTPVSEFGTYPSLVTLSNITASEMRAYFTL